MIDNTELPIGFAMELAMHPDSLNRFAQLPQSERQAIIDKARNAQTREEMRLIVESIK